MPNIAHRIAGILALLCIATFFLLTILIELFGSHATVAQLKSLIVTRGLDPDPGRGRCWRQRHVAVEVAQGSPGGCQEEAHAVHRGQWSAGAGALAIVLDRWAAVGSFDTSFYLVQAIELVAGAANLTLMGLNVRDGYA